MTRRASCATVRPSKSSSLRSFLVIPEFGNESPELMKSLASSEKCLGMLPRTAAAPLKKVRISDGSTPIWHLSEQELQTAQSHNVPSSLRFNVPRFARVRISIGRMPPAFSEGHIPEHSPHCWHFQIGLSARMRSRSAVPARGVFTFRASAPPDFTLCFFVIADRSELFLEPRQVVVHDGLVVLLGHAVGVIHTEYPESDADQRDGNECRVRDKGID